MIGAFDLPVAAPLCFQDRLRRACLRLADAISLLALTTTLTLRYVSFGREVILRASVALTFVPLSIFSCRLYSGATRARAWVKRMRFFRSKVDKPPSDVGGGAANAG